MKCYHLPILYVLLLCDYATLPAQIEKSEVENACCKYQLCLKTENDGAITSTLIHLTRLYYLYPQEDYTLITSELDSLIAREKSEQITMMAKMVRQYFNQELDLDWMMSYSYEEVYNFFTILASSNLKDVALKK
jgi:hypothetical protein